MVDAVRRDRAFAPHEPPRSRTTAGPVSFRLRHNVRCCGQGGTPVFVGTRVPFQNLIDYLAGGDSLDEFLHQFPSVTRAQAQAALGVAREALEASVAV